MDIEKLERAKKLQNAIALNEIKLSKINNNEKFEVYSPRVGRLEIPIEGEILEILRLRQKAKVDKLKKEFEEL